MPMPTMILDERLVLLDAVQADATGVISALADRLFELGLVRPDFKENVLAREVEHPTGLEGMYCRFALAHTESTYVTQSALAMARPVLPVAFERMDGEDGPVLVELVFVLALDSKGHLEVLSSLAQHLQQPGYVQQLLGATDPADVLALLAEL